jgi:hypothetical protein
MTMEQRMKTRQFRWAPLGAVLFSAAAFGQDLQKFPLRPGEWEVTIPFASTKEAPAILRLCLNDQLWLQALAQNPTCTVQNLAIGAKGGSYTLDCPTGVADTKVKMELSFDGKEHMVAKGNFEVNQNGATSHSVHTLDYRWKDPDCKPDDVNISKPNPQ